MELFERQELWDNLILCCQLLGKKPQAVSLIHRELQVQIWLSDPRLPPNPLSRGVPHLLLYPLYLQPACGTLVNN